MPQRVYKINSFILGYVTVVACEFGNFHTDRLGSFSKQLHREITEHAFPQHEAASLPTALIREFDSNYGVPQRTLVVMFFEELFMHVSVDFSK